MTLLDKFFAIVSFTLVVAFLWDLVLTVFCRISGRLLGNLCAPLVIGSGLGLMAPEMGFLYGLMAGMIVSITMYAITMSAYVPGILAADKKRNEAAAKPKT